MWVWVHACVCWCARSCVRARVCVNNTEPIRLSSIDGLLSMCEQCGACLFYVESGQADSAIRENCFSVCLSSPLLAACHGGDICLSWAAGKENKQLLLKGYGSNRAERILQAASHSHVREVFFHSACHNTHTHKCKHM